MSSRPEGEPRLEPAHCLLSERMRNRHGRQAEPPFALYAGPMEEMRDRLMADNDPDAWAMWLLAKTTGDDACALRFKILAMQNELHWHWRTLKEMVPAMTMGDRREKLEEFLAYTEGGFEQPEECRLTFLRWEDDEWRDRPDTGEPYTY
jgi:hypothetical protein